MYNLQGTNMKSKKLSSDSMKNLIEKIIKEETAKHKKSKKINEAMSTFSDDQAKKGQPPVDMAPKAPQFNIDQFLSDELLYEIEDSLYTVLDSVNHKVMTIAYQVAARHLLEGGFAPQHTNQRALAKELEEMENEAEDYAIDVGMEFESDIRNAALEYAKGMLGNVVQFYVNFGPES